MSKYQNRYRIESTRLQYWDYGWNASYFITICTKKRVCYFGQISNHKMKLSKIGEIVQKYWFEIPQHYPFVKLGAFIVMPNHIHGILIIDKNGDQIKNGTNMKSQNLKPPIVNTPIVETPNLGVSTPSNGLLNEPSNGLLKPLNALPNVSSNTSNMSLDMSSNPPNKTNKKKGGKNPKWKPNTLGSIINQYKRICTINARKTDPYFGWQARFYDNIVRNEHSFNNISQYIINNPQKWKYDKFYENKKL